MQSLHLTTTALLSRVQKSVQAGPHLVPVDRLRDGEGEKPEGVNNEVKLFNDGPEEFRQESAVTLRIGPGLDQGLSRSDHNVLQLHKEAQLERLDGIRQFVELAEALDVDDDEVRRAPVQVGGLRVLQNPLVLFLFSERQNPIVLVKRLLLGHGSSFSRPK